MIIRVYCDINYNKIKNPTSDFRQGYTTFIVNILLIKVCGIYNNLNINIYIYTRRLLSFTVFYSTIILHK